MPRAVRTRRTRVTEAADSACILPRDKTVASTSSVYLTFFEMAGF